MSALTSAHGCRMNCRVNDFGMVNYDRGVVASFVAAMLLALLGGSAGAAADDVDRVLVVRNSNSAVSMAIADDYVSRRHVSNVLTIKCKDSSVLGNEVPDPNVLFRLFLGTRVETIGLDAYRKDVEQPIKAFLSTHPNIDFIVLTKGIPIRIDGAGEQGNIDRFSLDDQIAALGYEGLPEVIRVRFADSIYDDYWLEHFHKHFRAHVWANRFWNSPERFSHAKFGGYLVTRLDGYTEADAAALTQHCLQAEQQIRSGNLPSGKILLDMAPEMGIADINRVPYSVVLERISPSQREVTIVSEKAHIADFNAGMELAADQLQARGIEVILDRSTSFVGNQSGLMGYVSFGSNDAHFEASAYHSLTFAPGAIAETAVSSSARTFLPTKGGQSLIADLIAQGVTGVKGYVDEPLAQAVASPSILFDRYSKGWTLAESFYAASAMVGWEDLVIGDPLCRAYPPVKSRDGSH